MTEGLPFFATVTTTVTITSCIGGGSCLIGEVITGVTVVSETNNGVVTSLTTLHPLTTETTKTETNSYTTTVSSGSSSLIVVIRTIKTVTTKATLGQTTTIIFTAINVTPEQAANLISMFANEH
jgi:hypothetical protein